MPNDLANYIAKKQAEAQQPPSIDWMKRRDRWLKELNVVFENITSILKDAGLPANAITSGEREIVEEKLGRYTAPTLSVTLPDGVVIDFNPLGSVIIGGFGRVDVSARNGIAKRLLIAADADEEQNARSVPSYERKWQWEFLEPGRSSKAEPISPTSLMDVIIDVTKAPVQR